MKILFMASDNYSASGAFLSMANLNKILKEKYDVDTLVILPCDGDGKDILKRYSVQYKVVRSFHWCVSLKKATLLSTKIKTLIKRIFNLCAILRLILIIKKEKFEIVHINTTYTYVGAVAAKWCGIPVIWHLREFLEEDQECKIWNREKGYNLIGNSNKIIAISNSIHKKYYDIFPETKLVTILNGINERDFYIPEREIFTSTPIIISIVGTISHSKGQHELIKAISMLKPEEIKKIKVLIIGKGNQEDEKEILALIKQNQLENTVYLQGYQNNIPYWFSKTDIAVICSKSEAFGRITVEAMMAGCLVIGADTAGTQELITSNETGLLYHAGSPGDLSNKVSYAISESEHMRVLAHAGQEYMLHNMTAELNAENIYLLYNELLKDK